MENDNQASVVDTQVTTNEAPAQAVAQPEVKSEVLKEKSSEQPEKLSLRKSLEKNFKASEDTSGKPVKEASASKEIAVNTSTVNGEAQQQQQQQEIIVAPASMNAAEKEAFAKASPELQKFLSRREYETRSHFSQQSAQLAQAYKEVSDIASVITPEVRQKFTRDGIAIPDLIKRSIAWDARVKEGIDGALEFLEAYGYKPEQLANHKSQPETPQYLTREEALEIARNEIQQQVELQQQSSLAQQRANELQSFISSKPIFKGDPNTASQFEEVMAEHLEFLMFKNPNMPTAQLLETSYQRAISSNPAFNPVAQPQQAATKQEDINQQMERVRSAKAAARSANGHLGSGTPRYANNTLRESLERNWAKS